MMTSQSESAAAIVSAGEHLHMQHVSLVGARERRHVSRLAFHAIEPAEDVEQSQIAEVSIPPDDIAEKIATPDQAVLMEEMREQMTKVRNEARNEARLEWEEELNDTITRE